MKRPPECLSARSPGHDLPLESAIRFRRRDDNKNTICVFEGGGLGVREENRPKTWFFVGSATTIKILKVQILLSRNFVVIAQAPIVEAVKANTL